MQRRNCAQPLRRVVDRRGNRVQAVFERALKDERLFAIGLCGNDLTPMRRTANFPRSLTCEDLLKAAQEPDPRIAWQGGPLHVGLHEIQLEGGEKVSHPPHRVREKRTVRSDPGADVTVFITAV